jgi:hypothetical protein
VLSGLAERRRSLVNQLEDMRGKLVAVAENLASSIGEGVRVDADGTEHLGGGDDVDPGGDEETPVDPRYEDRWGKGAEPLQIPDLAPLDLDLEKWDE